MVAVGDSSSIFKIKKNRIKKNNIVPVRFQLMDIDGNFVGGATAAISLTKLSDTITGSDNEQDVDGPASTGNVFAYDSAANEYFFNIGAASLAPGTWQVRIDLDDGTSRYVIFTAK